MTRGLCLRWNWSLCRGDGSGGGRCWGGCISDRRRLKRGGCRRRSRGGRRSPCCGRRIRLFGLWDRCGCRWRDGRLRDCGNRRRGEQAIRNRLTKHSRRDRDHCQYERRDQPLPAAHHAGAARTIKNNRARGLDRTNTRTRGKQGKHREENDNQCDARAYVHKLQDYTASYSDFGSDSVAV